MNHTKKKQDSLARFVQQMNMVQVDIESLRNATQDRAVSVAHAASSTRREGFATIVASADMHNATQDICVVHASNSTRQEAFASIVASEDMRNATQDYGTELWSQLVSPKQA